LIHCKQHLLHEITASKMEYPIVNTIRLINNDNANSKNKRNYIIAFISIFILTLFYIFQIVVGGIFLNNSCEADLRYNYSKLNIGFGVSGL
jgi:hypothetical protein